MSKLNVIRASAGSGKTYRITFEYLLLLFKNPKNFRHILAVTFTNKATEEMKRRILDELYLLSSDEKSNYRDVIKEKFQYSDDELKFQARSILNSILHNYSRFSVTTIDSFFQRIIKSFAREAGLQFNFEVELEINEVLEKATEQMIAALRSNVQLTKWLTNFAEKRVDEGKSWDFKKEILSLGKQLFNEKFNSFPLTYHQRISDKESLSTLFKQYSEIETHYEKSLSQAGIKGLERIKACGLSYTDFKNGSRGGPGVYFKKIASGNFDQPTKTILAAAESVEEWLPKDKILASQIQTLAENGLFQHFTDTIAYQTKKRAIYNSAKAITQNFYTLGILSDLISEVNYYRNQKNIFLLAQSGQFLKEIIDDNDAPFIYEKAGQTFSHFMIDEFQDTSGIQWFNFKPLIINSLSLNQKCILVGDIKQSIYRWRNSDWKIMAHQLTADAGNFGLQEEHLQQNWRSTERIIAFNNTCFTKAAQLIQNEFNTEVSLSHTPNLDSEFFQTIITSAYQDCCQQLSPNTPAKQGHISIQFIENNEKDWKEKVLTQLPEHIMQLLNAGNEPRDIAILVRSARDGRQIIEAIQTYNENLQGNEGSKIQVLSGESAFLENSDVIKFIIEVFKFIAQPSDYVNAAALANDYYNMQQNANNLEIHRFASQAILPNEFLENIEKLKLLSPQILFEKVCSIFDLKRHTKNLPFLQTFNDSLLKYEISSSASLLGFLNFWEEKREKISVDVSESQNAIRLMTFHKSKGLEFKSVIIPFCNWELEPMAFHAPTIWCSSQDSPFNQLDYFPVKYSSDLAESAFSADYFLEKSQSLVDNLNLLYVAFTRSIGNLEVFCPLPVKTDKLKNIADVLYNVVRIPDTLANKAFPNITFNEFWQEEQQLFELGTIWAPISQKRKNEKTMPLPLNTFVCNAVTENLRQKSASRDFWDHAEISPPSKRSYGNLMHHLFQEIITTEDIPKATKKLAREGLIREHEMVEIESEVLALLSDIRVKNWYSGYYKTINEAEIIVPELHYFRPDRVMFSQNETIVVDYKFGNKQSNEYTVQVKDYAHYLQNMGYINVKGFVWYVNLNKLEQVELNELPLGT